MAYGSPREKPATWLRACLWLLLGGWLGAWILFAFVVAPTAFRVLPSTQIAGELVGPVLAALHLYGVGAGIALAVLAWALARTGAGVWIPLAMGALCLLSQFGVTGQIEAIRGLAFGPSGNQELDGDLHRRGCSGVRARRDPRAGRRAAELARRCAEKLEKFPCRLQGAGVCSCDLPRFPLFFGNLR
jgi:hypothetical protein